jgi:ribosomal protein L34E
LEPGQGNKWLCSRTCRKASQALSVRTFHKRRPQQEAIYRARTKAKKLPDGNLVRFYRTNPKAPKACESCGEERVLDVAHRPDARRLGQWRSSRNCKWPAMVWVLCPTCHALLDRMHYPPEELGLF